MAVKVRLAPPLSVIVSCSRRISYVAARLSMWTYSSPYDSSPQNAIVVGPGVIVRFERRAV